MFSRDIHCNIFRLTALNHRYAPKQQNNHQWIPTVKHRTHFIDHFYNSKIITFFQPRQSHNGFSFNLDYPVALQISHIYSQANTIFVITSIMITFVITSIMIG